MLAQMNFDKIFYYIDKILNNFISAKISQINFNKILPTYH